ncbi:RHS repeat-associated protein [Tenacibaculum skagerrakense]|uniref:RHS repeat-associated protein n=1 Tax=Tenacibaculum skagerrakense TaxID=186571 RepID=A0A4R2NRA5_9FLAO|nr:DUF6443 domain-containing protein [Tenacibaculum skagerrakense]TCP24242.1 RHS repeat-associated protein [Tenacibaculum skagerrakense]
MKRFILSLVFLLPIIAFSQSEENVIIENETITGNSQIIASNSIVIRPSTIIQSGANFSARILWDVYTPLSLSNENYVLTRDFQIATQGTTVESNKDVIETVVYYDGLGRPIQNIGIKQSPTKKDIVTHFEYDDYGRQAKEYLPYPSDIGNGSLKTNATDKINNYYWTNYQEDFSSNTNVNAYAEKLFDGSPLNRVLKQGAPGNDWKATGIGGYSYYDHAIESDYKNNIVNEVFHFTMTLDNTRNSKVYEATLNPNPSYYQANELYKSIVRDENHTAPATGSKLHTKEEFTNKEGQVVLKRTYALVNNVEEAHDTYYVYDDFGNLSFVLPPKVTIVDGVSTTELSELCYQYTYDYRNRMVKKKIPGKGEEYIIYDKLNRPVLTQDVNLRANKEWLFTKYDAFGRIVYTGKYTHATILDQAAMQQEFDAYNIGINACYEEKLTTPGALDIYYSNINFPSTNLEVFTVNYYDDYTFNKAGAPINASSFGVDATTRLQGLATGAKIKVLNTNDWITSVTYYDEKARPFYIYTNNSFLQTTDIVTSKLDFVGRVEETITTHKKVGQEDIIIGDNYTYDHVGRLLKQSQEINNQEAEILYDNKYNDLGMLSQKNVGSTLQTVDYAFNVRGWLTKINEDSNDDNDLFNYEIKYNTPSSGQALFNGNIAQTSWQTLNVDITKRGYNYSYDALNRVLSATGLTSSNYDISGITYDKNGNIQSLVRKGHTQLAQDGSVNSFGVMDDLVYTYDSGNKLTKVIDNSNIDFGFKDGDNISNDYSFDDNGNLIIDENKGVNSITYNHLNVPETVVFTDQSTIKYTYDATGAKVSKEVIDNLSGNNTTIHYAGDYTYQDGILEFIKQTEGYIVKNNSNFNYVYTYNDLHQNTRLTYSDSNNDGFISKSEIIEESNYYPFGLKHKGYNNITSSNGNSLAQKWGFQGQELHDELGLNVNEFKYRFYDPAHARFWSLDPLAEDFVYNSTYAFAENKIGMGMELEGREIFFNDIASQLAIMAYQGYQSIKNKFSSGVNDVTDSYQQEMKHKVGVTNSNYDPETDRIKRMAGVGKVAETVTDSAHLVADLAGTAEPTPIIDTLHALTYGLEGDWTSAGFTFLGVFSYGGDSFKMAKYADEFGELGGGIVRRFIDNLTRENVEGTSVLSSQIWEYGSELLVDVQLIFREEGYGGKVLKNFLDEINKASAKLGSKSQKITFETVLDNETVEMYRKQAKIYGYEFSTTFNEITQAIDVIWTKK